MTQQARLMMVVAVSLALISACAGSSGGTPSSAPATQAESGSQDSSYDSAANVEALYSGTYAQPPSNSPKPMPARKVWVISYLQAMSSAAATADAMQQAGRALGWDVTVFDSQGDPAKANDGINQAIAAKADGILAIYWDCSAVKAGLLAAQQAKVFTIAEQSADCEGQPLYDYVVSYQPGPDFYEGQDGQFINYINGWQRVTADYIAAKSNNAAKVIYFSETDAAVFAAQDAGFFDQIRKCTGCELVDTVKFTAADLGPALQQKAQQAFLAHPDVTAIAVGADYFLTSGVIAALKSSGLYGKVIIGGGEGGSETIPLMRDYAGSWGFTSLPTAWDGWQAADALNRLFNGQKPVMESGIGYQIVDKDHNLPPGDSPMPMANGKPIDFAAQYKAAWAAAQ